MSTIDEKNRQFEERVFEKQLIRNINESFDDQIIRNTTSSSKKNDLNFLSNVQQRKFMFFVRDQIKNELNEIIVSMQQQLINLIVIFTKLVELISAINAIDVENTFFDSFILFIDVIVILLVKLRAKNVKYFDFDYKQKKKYSKIEITKTRFYDFVVNVDKYIYYINVYTFLDKLKNLITTHDNEIVLNVVAFCFRNTIYK